MEEKWLQWNPVWEEMIKIIVLQYSLISHWQQFVCFPCWQFRWWSVPSNTRTDQYGSGWMQSAQGFNRSRQQNHFMTSLHREMGRVIWSSSLQEQDFYPWIFDKANHCFVLWIGCPSRNVPLGSLIWEDVHAFCNYCHTWQLSKNQRKKYRKMLAEIVGECGRIGFSYHLQYENVPDDTSSKLYREWRQYARVEVLEWYPNH